MSSSPPSRMAPERKRSDVRYRTSITSPIGRSRCRRSPLGESHTTAIGSWQSGCHGASRPLSGAVRSDTGPDCTSLPPPRSRPAGSRGIRVPVTSISLHAKRSMTDLGTREGARQFGRLHQRGSVHVRHGVQRLAERGGEAGQCRDRVPPRGRRAPHRSVRPRPRTSRPNAPTRQVPSRRSVGPRSASPPVGAFAWPCNPAPVPSDAVDDVNDQARSDLLLARGGLDETVDAEADERDAAAARPAATAMRRSAMFHPTVRYSRRRLRRRSACRDAASPVMMRSVPSGCRRQ